MFILSRAKEEQGLAQTQQLVAAMQTLAAASQKSAETTRNKLDRFEQCLQELQGRQEVALTRPAQEAEEAPSGENNVEQQRSGPDSRSSKCSLDQVAAGLQTLAVAMQTSTELSRKKLHRLEHTLQDMNDRFTRHLETTEAAAAAGAVLLQHC